MVTDEERQKLIIRQSCIKGAIDLLTTEQNNAKSGAEIPIASIESKTLEIEALVWKVLEQPKKQQRLIL